MKIWPLNFLSFLLLLLIPCGPSKAVIVGQEDSREKVSSNESIEYGKYKSIGAVGKSCTGTLIGPNDVLTAAHCVFDLKKKKWKNDLNFANGTNRAASFFYKKQIWKRAYIPKAYFDGDDNYDIALIKLDRNIGKKTGWTKLGYYPESSPEATSPANIAGYPGDKALMTMWEVDCSIDLKHSYSPANFHKCDTYEGMSGAALTTKDPDGDDVIYGVHAGSTMFRDDDKPSINRAIIINEQLFKMIKGWKKNSHHDYESVTKTNTDRPDHFKVVFHNKCHKKLEAAIKYKDVNGNWQKKAWMKLSPGKHEYIVNTKSKIFYYYAESIGKDKMIWKGKYGIYFDGIKYNAKKVEINYSRFGNYIKTLTCD